MVTAEGYSLHQLWVNALGLYLADLPDWYADAACAHGADPEIFFPELGQTAAPALAICAGCPVRDQCLQYAKGTDQHYGVWGGTTERQRQDERGHALRQGRSDRSAA